MTISSLEARCVRFELSSYRQRKNCQILYYQHFWLKKISSVKQIFAQKILVQKNNFLGGKFGSKIFFQVKQILRKIRGKMGQKKFWGLKRFCLVNGILRSKNFSGSKNVLGKNNFRVKKMFGRKHFWVKPIRATTGPSRTTSKSISGTTSMTIKDIIKDTIKYNFKDIFQASFNPIFYVYRLSLRGGGLIQTHPRIQ